MRQVLTITILSILLLAISAFATGPLFKGPIISPGNSYYRLCAAELDNDGDPDLIVTDQGNSVAILLTHSDGSFTSPVLYNISGPSGAVASADFDGDGYNDIAISREIGGGDEYLGILLNNGDGTFAAPVDYISYNNAYDIVTADFDGDDDIDILASTHYVAQLYLNNGDGSFAAAVDINAATGMNTGLAAADFDNDGDIDFAINNYEIDSTQVFLNNGTGGFISLGRFSSGHYPYSLAAAYINNDLFYDLVIGNRVTDSCTILINNGNGTFAAPVQYKVGSDAYCAEPADLDNDGDIDLAVASWTGQRVSVLLNDGDGVFAPAINYIDGVSPSVVTGDFDKDGFLDLAMVNGSNSIKVMYNNGDGSFYVNPALPVGTGAWAIATGDYDNNGYIDMAVTNNISDDLSLFLNNGDTTFATETYTGLPVGAGPKGITMADLDDDSYDEIIVADFAADKISVKHHSNPVTTDYMVGDGPNSVVAADFDGDGDLDLAAAYENEKVINIFLNDGAGALSTYSAFSSGVTPYNMIVADLDGDGDKDIATANAGTYPNYYQHVYFNGGSGSFLTGTTLPSSGTCSIVAAADIDGDSDNDLIYITDEGRLYFYKNGGLGSFTDSSSFDLDFTAGGIYTGDFDLDGDIDITINDRWNGNIVVYSNDGNGNFGNPRYYRAGEEMLGFTGVDLDNDGDEELISVTQTDATDSLKIFWNRRDLIPLDNNDNHHGSIPSLFTLNQNYPNPFNPVTTIDYYLPRRADVSITIFNLLGQTVQTLVNNQQAAGSYSITWDGRDNSGKTAASGLYFYRLKAGEFAESKKMIMLK
jgi:hypothetical protein